MSTDLQAAPILWLTAAAISLWQLSGDTWVLRPRALIRIESVMQPQAIFGISVLLGFVVWGMSQVHADFVAQRPSADDTTVASERNRLDAGTCCT